MRHRILLALLPLAAETAAACPDPGEPVPVAITADGATIVGDGGIVFQQVYGHSNDVRSPTLRDKTGAPVAGEWRQLAPLLLLFQPTTALQRDLEVVDAATSKTLVTVHQLPASDATAQTAPIIQSAHADLSLHSRTTRAEVIDRTHFQLVLRTPPPPQTIALIILDASTRGRVWFLPNGKTYETTLGGGKSCTMELSPIYAGERIRVAWIDVLGRVSPASKPVRVGIKRPLAPHPRR